MKDAAGHLDHAQQGAMTAAGTSAADRAAVVYHQLMDDEAILAAALTGVVGLLGVVVGAYLTQRAQHAQWLRERKIAAITSYVEDVSLVVDRLHAGLAPTTAERVDLLHRMQSGRTTIHLLCDEATRSAAEELARRTRRLEQDQSKDALDAAVQSLKQFVTQARSEVVRRRA